MPPEPAITLSTAQLFEQERMHRIIDATTDLKALQEVAKQCFSAWLMQKSAAVWMLKSTLPHAINYAEEAHALATRSETGHAAPPKYSGS